VKIAAEHELKLEAEGALDLARLGGEPLESRVFTSTYHDTADLRLLRSGITLRRRLELGVNTWQLKIPLDAVRHEIEERGAPAAPPEGITDALTALLRGRTLEAVATLRTRRDGVRVETKSGAAEVTVDNVAVLDGLRSADTFVEIEVELVQGDAGALKRIGKRVRALGADRAPAEPKVTRVLGVPHTEPPQSDTERLRVFLTMQTDKLLAADPAVRLDLGDEAVHAMRVACRRMRSALRTARPMIARDWADELRAELGWLASALGDLRDLDVGIKHLEDESADLGDEKRGAEMLISQLRRARKKARRQALTALSSQRYFALLDRLERSVGELPILETTSTLDQLAAKELRRLERCVDSLDDASDQTVHRARILGKRARYSAELVGADAVADAAKEFQDVVGAHQDALVLAQRVRDAAAASGDPRVSVAAGRIIERELGRRQDSRSRVEKAWRRLDRAGRKAYA
jgi:CHAD domain-containing protein